MTVKDFLNSNKGGLINLSELAREMWPSNAGARAYLQKKLTGVRPWTDSDTELALKALNKLAVDISKLK